MSVGWGIAGCGWVARDYAAPVLARAVRAVYDPDPGARAAIGRVVPDATPYDDLDAFLRADGVDAVYVAAPNWAHRPLVTAVAAAGRAVLCEKPLATTVADAAAMVSACAAAGVLAGTAYDQRWHPAHTTIAGLVAAGEVGTVTAVRVAYGCWLPPDWAPDNWRADPARAGGGAVLDLAPHGLDLVGVLLGGDDVVSLSVLRQRRVHDYPVEDGGVLIGRTAGGVLLSSHVSYNTPDALPRRRLEVVGTGGQLVAVDTMGQTPGGSLTLTRADGTPVPVDFDAGCSPFAAQLAAFGAAVAGATHWPHPLDRDLRLHELLLGALEEAR